MGIKRRPDLDDIDVDSCLANLHRIPDIEVKHPMRRRVIDLREPAKREPATREPAMREAAMREAGKVDPRLVVDVDAEVAKYHAGV
jgi:hypothetical protein